jgi:hypothetical protein
MVWDVNASNVFDHHSVRQPRATVLIELAVSMSILAASPSPALLKIAAAIID